ncbi:MAG: Eco57I restriction-modification methylase domain-containing protein, partial [Desulfobacterota bacterium]|nr:Eco57I restriction-modification methylase domain-containing protein [Thermodesulfobacteriota bacterium]
VKKLRFYQGEPGIREAELKSEEIAIFRDILHEKRIALQKAITALTRQIEGPPKQGELIGIAPAQAKEEHLKLQKQWRAERDEHQAQLTRIEAALDALARTQTVPFVWDIAFVEIFGSERRGFDIVIGNPPYVRQEKISPPTLDATDFSGESSDRWKEEKKTYKAKLQESIASSWPKFFRYKPGSRTFRKPDGKSDLYVYFYFHGLSLLNPHGSFCFITSNSWLDVGYGADLQEFLLRHSHVKFILDNERKRSFSQADVNTIIALLAPPDDRSQAGLEKTAHFVMFKVPFEEVLDANTFKTLEAAKARQTTDKWRISVVSQCELLEEGLAHEQYEKDDVAKLKTVHIKIVRYQANKWGGKYLRAPEMFFTILEKGKGKLVRLGDIAEVRFGIKTGANEFFYLEPTGKPAPKGYIHVRNSAGWEGEIEEEFLKPVIKSPRECRTILIKPEDLRYKIFMCHRDKSELKRTAALEYIGWGEAQGFHKRPTCRNRVRWWDLELVKGNSVFVKEADETTAVFYNLNEYAADCRLYLAQLSKSQLAFLNSPVGALFFEIHSRSVLGEGARSLMVADYKQVPCIAAQAQEMDVYFEMVLGEAPRRFQSSIPDSWRMLDQIVFDVLGLTQGEREAVYEAVINLVRARLEKAKSV